MKDVQKGSVHIAVYGQPHLGLLGPAASAAAFCIYLILFLIYTNINVIFYSN